MSDNLYRLMDDIMRLLDALPTPTEPRPVRYGISFRIWCRIVGCTFVTKVSSGGQWQYEVCTRCKTVKNDHFIGIPVRPVDVLDGGIDS